MRQPGLHHGPVKSEQINLLATPDKIRGRSRPRRMIDL
jgi:hypothetical protein